MTGDGTHLVLDTDLLNNGGGLIQVDAQDDSGPPPTLELKNITISEGSIDNAGLILVGTGTSTIVNVANGIGEVFTNTGTIQVTGDGTRLVLDNDVLDNTDGLVQVDAESALGPPPAPVLELKTTTIDDGSIVNAGLIVVSSGTNTISNVANPDDLSGELFTNTGTIQVDATTTLILDTSVLTNGIGFADGTVEVNGTLQLQSSTIDLGIVTIASGGLLEATAGSSTISNTTTFTNGDTLEVSGTATLLLSDVVVTNTAGTVHVSAAGATLTLQDATVNDGSIVNEGTLLANGGVTSTISNVANGGIEAFTNTRTIHVTGDGTRLVIESTVVNDTLLDNTDGLVQVDAESDFGAGADPRTQERHHQ